MPRLKYCTNMQVDARVTRPGSFVIEVASSQSLPDVLRALMEWCMHPDVQIQLTDLRRDGVLPNFLPHFHDSTVSFLSSGIKADVLNDRLHYLGGMQAAI